MLLNVKGSIIFRNLLATCVKRKNRTELNTQLIFTAEKMNTLSEENFLTCGQGLKACQNLDKNDLKSKKSIRKEQKLLKALEIMKTKKQNLNISSITESKRDTSNFYYNINLLEDLLNDI